MTPILSVESLRVSYGGIHAVGPLSFEIFPGETVSLIGANGAGKSSTLKALSGLIPAEGAIQFEGREILGLKPHLIVNLGLIHCPEGRGVFANLTVLENLKLGAYRLSSANEEKKTLAWCYNVFPILKEREKQKAGLLSGGEQQMLAMARSLMAKPKLLMLDEPSLGLAPIVVQKVFSVIRELSRDLGLAILLVEQNAFMALQVARRAYVLESGTCVASGLAAELIDDNRIRQAYLGL